MKPRPALAWLFWLVCLVALGGCVTATVQEVRETASALGSSDSIVVLGRRSQPTSDETELDFITCVANQMRRGDQQLNVIAEAQFIDETFPWFEPRTAPLQTRDLAAMIGRDPLAGRLRQLGLKYLIWVEGSTQRIDSGGSLACAVSPAGGGCFGFLSWENDSDYEATIWDAETGRSVGSVSSEASGMSYMPAVIVPIPIIARVKASACSSLANQLRAFVVGGEAPAS